MPQLLLRHCSAASLYTRGHAEPLCLWRCQGIPKPRRSSRGMATTRAVAVAAEATEDHLGMPIERYRALVLDSSYRPINVINWQRAVCLDFLDKVDVLEYYNVAVSSASSDYLIPAVMRVRLYVRREIRKGHLAISRRNIMTRDMWTCQYCGGKNDLTLDHVVPMSAGGKWSWENLVTACETCNGLKGNKALEQLGWKLRRPPSEPSPYEFGILLGLEMGIKATPKEWSDYLLPLNKVTAGQMTKKMY
ncbi:hypothetical protein WJX73_010577 [Symbiochloris irregularis]|uniref:HNH nuclease domain-containing protein n=1 Tax=Symbiochloris irregularis TaxID=706552 RepID=A0AAW1P0W8_9CHLO